MNDDPANRLKVKRGSQLPQSRLTEDDVRLIRQLVEQRDELIRRARELTNARIAEKFDVHRRTIDRVTSGEGWGHC